MHTHERRLNRRRLLQLALGVRGSLAANAARPALRAAASAARPAGAPAPGPVCFETLQATLDLCATMEHMMVTLYCTTITQGDGPFACPGGRAQLKSLASQAPDWQKSNPVPGTCTLL